MSTPAQELHPPRRSIKKIQNPMPAPPEILKGDLSWLCTKGDRYEFLASSSKILEYQLQKGNETFGTVTLAKHDTSVSSSNSSSSSSNRTSSTNNMTILVSLKIYIPCMRHDITARLKKYSKFIVNYEEVTAKKSDRLHIATSVFTYEAKKAFEEFGVATELTQIISDTINLFHLTPSPQVKQERPRTRSRSSSSDSNSNFSLIPDSDTESSLDFNSNSSVNSNATLGTHSTSSDNTNSSSSFASRNKRRHKQIIKLTSNEEDKPKDVISSFKREKLSSEETDKQSSELEKQPPPLLFSKNTITEIPRQPPEETYSITGGSYEHFKANDESILVFTRSKPDNGILQLILSRSIINNIFSEDPRKIVYSIKIALDLTKPDFYKMANFYREKLRLEDLKMGNQKIHIFNMNTESCLQSCLLKQDHFIFLLGKLMVPDEITKELSDICRTYSDCYNQTQTPTSQLSRQNSDNTVILSQRKSTSNSSKSTEALSQDGNNQIRTRSKSLTKS